MNIVMMSLVLMTRDNDDDGDDDDDASRHFQPKTFSAGVVDFV